MWNIRLFNTFHMGEAWTFPDRRLEGVEIGAASPRDDLDPPIRQVRRVPAKAESLGAPLREPSESDPLHASGDDPPYGLLVPSFPAHGAAPFAARFSAAAGHGAAARRLVLQT